MRTRMISIRLANFQETSNIDDLENLEESNDRFKDGTVVKGRVYLYDDTTKTLILKLWDDDQEKYTGIGVYNARNIMLERIHVL